MLSKIFSRICRCLESGYGTSDIANDKGNFWGWGAFDTDAYGLAHSFTEVPDGIEEVARGLNSYMTPGTESYNVIVNNGYDPVTMQGVASRYCPGNPNYASTIKSIVKMIFGNTHFSSGDINASEMQERIVSIIKNGEVQPVSGYCAAWVYDVYARAGQTRVGKCCANQARLAWAISMDQTSMPLGACVYAGEAYHSNTICSACGTNARHVAIYIGDGMVASPEGYIRIMTLDQFISIYSWGGWGWNGGIDYSI